MKIKPKLLDEVVLMRSWLMADYCADGRDLQVGNLTSMKHVILLHQRKTEVFRFILESYSRVEDWLGGDRINTRGGCVVGTRRDQRHRGVFL